jgi:maleylacetoacetate isomerase
MAARWYPNPMIRLYDFWLSSSAWRVRIALHLKHLPFEAVAVDLFADEHQSGPLAAANPLRQVPTLEVDGVTLTQSLAIIHYLDHLHPEPRLVPSDPLERARAIQLTEIVNAGIQPLQNRSVLRKVDELGADGRAFAQHFIARGLAALEAAAAPERDFLLSDEVTVADVFLVPQLAVARRMDVPLDAHPRLLAVESGCVALAAFAAAHPSVQPDARAT